MLQNSDLCAACASTTEIITLDVAQGHHSSWEAINSACKDGCPLCVWVLDVFRRRWLKREGREPDSADFLAGWRLDVQLVKNFNFGVFVYEYHARWMQQEEQQERPKEESMCMLILPEQVHNTYPSLPASDCTRNEESFALSKQWLKNCLDNHPKCRQSAAEGWLPTRVLDVGTSSEPILRIHQHDGSFAASPYVTLSHCWGGVNIKRLLKSTLADMINGISLEELPKTFREAIYLVRSLGICYIWIDSLCIIQDSVEDWNRESAVMGKVYRHSILNIAATAAENGNDGCFFDRDPSLGRSCRLSIPALSNTRASSESPSSSSLSLMSASSYMSEPSEWSDTSVTGGEPNYSTSPTSTSYDLVAQGFYLAYLRVAPLNMRSWVLQEQYLAPRIIHCAKTQFIWECLQTTACEMFPDEVHPSVYDGYSFAFKWRDPNIPSIVENDTAVSSALTKGYLPPGCKRWNRLVLEYQARFLTVEQDKLVAISGIAKDLEPYIQTPNHHFGYLAGLWGEYLPEQLLWITFNPPYTPNLAKRSRTYRAPSWSWASIDGVTNALDGRLHRGHEFMIRVISATTKLITSDRMGQVSGGSISLLGRLKWFNLKLAEGEKKDYLVADGDIVAALQPDITAEFDICDRFLCLPVLECVDDDGDSGKEVHGLMLLPASVPGQYTRIGTFKSIDKGIKIFRVETHKSWLVSEDEKLPSPVNDLEAKLSSYSIEHELPNGDEIYDPWARSEKNFWTTTPEGGRDQDLDSNQWLESLITII